MTPLIITFSGNATPETVQVNNTPLLKWLEENFKMTTIPIPTYPATPAALLCALCDREMGRLLGPTAQQAIADDKTGDAHLAFSTAMAALRAAKAWVETPRPIINIQDSTPEPMLLPGERN